MDKMIEMSTGAYGTHGRWELDTLELSKCRTLNDVVQLSAFYLSLGTEKIQCNIGIYKSTVWNYDPRKRVNEKVPGAGFRVDISFNYLSNDIYWYSRASLCDYSGKCIYKSNINCHRSNGELITVFTIESDEDIKKLKFKHQRIFLHLDIVVCPRPNVTEIKLSNIKTSSCFNYCCKVTEDFGSLFKNKLLTDAIIVSRKKEFAVHRNILSIRSPHFADIFMHDTVEKRDGRVSIKNKDGELFEDEIVESFLLYVYTGCAKNLNHFATELYKIGVMYNMETLRKQCVAYLEKVIDINNATRLLIFAKKYDIKELKIKISEFYKTNCTIEQIDQFNQTTSFGTWHFMVLDSSLFNSESHEMVSRELKVKDNVGKMYEFRIKIMKSEDTYVLDMDFVGESDERLNSPIIIDFYNENRVRINNFYIIDITHDKPLKNFLPFNFMWHREMEQLFYVNKSVIFRLFIWDYLPVTENFTDVNVEEKYLYISDNETNSPHNCQFLDDLSTLYNNENFTDFSISTKDKKFNVHKNILAARSPAFAMKFKKDIDENTKNDNLTLEQKTEVVEEMLRYIYTGSIKNVFQLAIDLYEIAKDYELQSLQDECISQMFKNLSVENAEYVLFFAEKYKIQDLQLHVTKFFQQQIDEVLSSDVISEFDIKVRLSK